jgi:ribosomal-protein-alanine N-acetyltransferase
MAIQQVMTNTLRAEMPLFEKNVILNSDHSDIRYCEINSKDVEQVCELESICQINPWSQSLIEAEFSKNISRRFGYKNESKIVAYSFNHLILDEFHILNLGVSPEVRNHGFGTALVANILLYAIEKRARFATLEVRESNAQAQRIYHRFGFKCCRIRKGYYRDNRENALIFERSLKLSDAEKISDLSKLRVLSGSQLV